MRNVLPLSQNGHNPEMSGRREIVESTLSFTSFTCLATNRQCFVRLERNSYPFPNWKKTRFFCPKNYFNH